MDFASWAYKAGNYALRSFYKTFHLHPTSAPYVSGDGFRALATQRLETGGELDGSTIKAGDVVFVAPDELDRFRQAVLPRIKERFVLLSHNSDIAIDSSFADIADNPRLIAWFAQNAVFRHERIRAIPIGLENRWLCNNGIVGDFDRLRKRRRPHGMRILYAFSVGTNKTEREPALRALQASPLAVGPTWTDSRRYRKTLSEIAFVASPPGNGFDCHRTWEALYLGTIPIVRRSPFFESFPGLPVLQLDEWNELLAWDETCLQNTYAELAPKIAESPYLHLAYWTEQIETCRRRA